MAAGRIGLLWRGERGAPMSQRAEAMLGPLFAAFADLDITAEAITYSDDALDEVRNELLSVDGVVVWVNPIQDGANRANLDTLLREAAADGVWVSAHPDVIDILGTKEVLYRTRSLGWGSDIERYGSPAELAERLPDRLATYGRLVVKQARGNGGNGVWKIELIDRSNKPGPDSPVLLQPAQPRDASPERSTLGAFLGTCADYFAWSGCLIDQPYVDRLADGMVRCYYVHDEVVGFCHQWPKGLLAADPAGTEDQAPVVPVMEDADTPAYAALRTKAEKDWIPQMKDLLGLAAHQLPVIWDTDFLYGPKTADGQDTYVLCEINISAVWPFPPQGTRQLAQAAAALTIAAKDQRA
jgi:hypothetical protein